MKQINAQVQKKKIKSKHKKKIENMKRKICTGRGRKSK